MRADTLPGLPGRPAARAAGSLPWLSVFFFLLGLAASAGVAYAVHSYGLLALLLLPAIGLFLFSILVPEVGVVTLILVTTLQLSEVLIKFHHLPSIAQPLAAMLLVVILIRQIAFGERANGWLKAFQRLGVYGLVYFLAVLAAKAIDPALIGFQDLFKDFLVALILVFLVQDTSRLKHAVWAIILAGLLMGTISDYQQITHSFSNNYYGLGGWLADTSTGSTIQRITGPFANPNAYAQVLVVVIVLALDRAIHERNLLLRLTAAAAFILCGLTIFYTGSRGGLLTLLAGLALYLLEHRPRLLPLILIAAIAVAVVQYLPSSYLDRIATLSELVPTQSNAQVTDPSFRGRLSENMASWLMFRDNPVLGVGPKNFPDEYLSYSRKLGLDPRNVARAPASLYGEVLSEEGILGILAFAYLIYSIQRGLRQGKWNFKRARLTDAANLTSAIWVGLFAYLFEGIIKNSAYSNFFWLYLGLAMAAANVAANSYRARQNLIQEEALRQGRAA